MVINSTVRSLFGPATMGRKILVCSIGNPGAAYANTRHSAGHVMNNLLQEALSSGEFTKNKGFGGKVSFPEHDQTFTLWQSLSFMNISGKGVKMAWSSFLLGLEPEEKETAALVVVHDELEAALGKIKVKKAGSAGGHNGLISIIEQFQTKDFCRIGVGIGRPESKDPATVSNYVLGKMRPQELKVLEEKSLPLVIGELKKIAKLP